MADSLQTYVSVCAGGLVTNVDPLTQSNSLSGSAVRLINMEPSLEGGYRRISGYANSYGTLPGTGKVLGLNVNGEKYFWYHHTEADTIDKLDPYEVNTCVAAMTVLSYVLADMPQNLIK